MDNFKEADKALAKKFIDRQLTGIELDKVNKRLETDKAFAETLAFHVAMRDAFAAAEKEEVEVGKVAKLPTTNYLKFLWPVAAAFVGIIAFWFLLSQDKTTTKATIREAALIEFREALEVKTRLGNTLEVNDLIKKEAYTEALKLLLEADKSAVDKCKNDQVNYKLGMLLLYQQPNEKIAEAIPSLSCIYDYYREVYPMIPIHLARAYRWTGQPEKAVSIIQESRVELPADLQKLKD